MNAFHTLAALLAGLIADGATAAGYSAQDITPPGSPACSTRGLNDRGQVVGQATAADGMTRPGFITGPNGAAPRLVGTLGGTRSLLNDINGQGRAVGEASLPDGTVHAVVVEPGSDVLVDLGTLGGTNSDARAVNTRGHIVGRAALPDGQRHGFLAKSGRAKLRDLGMNGTIQAITDDGALAGGIDLPGQTVGFITGPNGTGLITLGSLGGTQTVALSINRKKTAVGLSTDGDGVTRAFVSSPDGSVQDLGVPGVFAVAQKINRHGTVVGAYVLDWALGMRAFVATSGRGFSDLSTLVASMPQGVTLSYASGLNDVGQIAAWGSDQRCYLLTPTP